MNLNNLSSFNILMFYAERFDALLAPVSETGHHFDLLMSREEKETAPAYRSMLSDPEKVWGKLKRGGYDIVICPSLRDIRELGDRTATTILMLEGVPETVLPETGSRISPVELIDEVHHLAADMKKLHVVFPSREVEERWGVRGEVIDHNHPCARETWNRFLGKCRSLNRLLDSSIEQDITAAGDARDTIVLERKGENRLRVCLFSYPIFAVDCFYTFREMGYEVIMLPMGRQVDDRLESWCLRSMVNFNPHFCLSLNFYPHLAVTLKTLRIPYASWLVDPVMDDTLWRAGVADDNNHVFSFSRSDMEIFKERGFRNVRHLPLAANTKRNRPREITGDVELKYGCTISFLGSSMTDNSYSLKLNTLLENIKGCQDSRRTQQAVQTINRCEEIINRQSESNRFILPHFADQLEKENGAALLPGWDAGFTKEGLIHALSEEASSRKRKKIIKRLAGLGVHLYGDIYWKWLEKDKNKVTYKGIVDNLYEIPLIYNASAINLNISRVQHTDMVIMRIFDILACRGFLLSDYNQELEEYFTLGEDLVSYRDADEAYDLAAYYLEHPEERKRIADSGHQKVVREHTIRKRLEYIVEKMGRASG